MQIADCRLQFAVCELHRATCSENVECELCRGILIANLH